MQLTKQTDFAFRTLIYLAGLPEGELSSIARVCEFYGISSNHLSKVVQRLGRAGLIETVRGKHGGIRLSRPVGEIDLLAVVLEMEPTLHPVNCEQPVCRISSECRLRGVLHEAMQAFLESLRGKTLQDIVLPGLADQVSVVRTL